jgi:NACHT domain/HEAT repeats
MNVYGGKGYEQRDNKGQIYNADKIIIINNPDSGKPQESITINWVELCQATLKRQQESQGLRHKATEKGFEVNVYVPLGLVERKEQSRRSIDDKAEMGEIYPLEKEVISQVYEHDEFLQQVIGKTSSGRNNHVAIIGEPGAGKTTLLGTVASFVLKPNPNQQTEGGENLAIFISLASLQGRTLEDYILKTWLVEAMELVSDIELTPEIKNQLEHQLKQRFKQGGVWLLLDGVDEMGFDSSAKALSTIQKQLTSWLSHARVALTCRLNVWDASLNNPLSGFDTYKTQDFEPEDIVKFIKDWFICAELPQRGEQLQTKLKEAGKERICELVKNPLRLSLLCQIFYLDKQAELPKTKAGLYHKCVRYFYQWKSQDVRNQKELYSALGKLAKAGINSKARFRLSETLGNQEMGENLFKLACDLGWLNLVNRDAETDEPVYAFFHPTFQEYFAACAIEDWDFFLPREHKNKPVKDKPYRIFESQWKEVILLWLGRENVGKQQKEQFINALVEFKDGCNDFYFYKAYFLAAVGIVEFKEYPQAEKIVKQIISWIHKVPIKKEIEIIIQQTELPIVIAALVELINSYKNYLTCNCFACIQAISILGKIEKNNPIAIDLSVELIDKYQKEFKHCQATSNLGEIGKDNPIAIDALVDLIANSQNVSTRILAQYLLGEISKDNPIAIDALVDLIANSQDEYTRSQAAESLGKIGKDNPIAIDALVDLIANSQDEYTRLLATVRLGEIGKDNPIAIDALVYLIANSQDESTRLLATVSLGEIGKDNLIAINTLVDLIANSQNKHTRMQAAESLGKIDKDNPIAINTLVDLIANSQNKYTRMQMTESLWNCAPNTPYPVFYQAWQQPHGGVFKQLFRFFQRLL